MLDPDIRAIADWLIDGARSAPLPQDVLSQLSERLVACGIPLWRVAVFVNTLHPQIIGRRFIWRPGADVEVSEGRFGLFDTPEFRENPVARVYATRTALRRRLADPDCPMDFPILQELRTEGVTDYVALPLFFTDGSVQLVTCTTRQAGGFNDAQVAGIEAIMTPLARVAEIRALRRTASTLLDTYVGHDAGERILAGQIHRGDIEEIHAAVWLSDMRGFTALAAAARQAQANITELSSSAMPGLRFGLALHIGDVLYGNIGSGNRLDFTCIGPAVNFAARLEKLAGELGRGILASGEFAQHCAGEFTALGEFTLPGFSAAQRVFGLEDETPI